jgi:hypothetical protein
MPKFGHTPYTKKQNVELAIASLITSIMCGENCKFVGPQNGPTTHEHANKVFTLF